MVDPRDRRRLVAAAGLLPPKAAAEGVRQAFKGLRLRLRPPSEAATLAARARGTRRPRPSVPDEWLQRRHKLILKGVKHRLEHRRPLGQDDRRLLFGADGAHDTLSEHFDGDPWKAFYITVELAAPAADNAPDSPG